MKKPHIIKKSSFDKKNANLPNYSSLYSSFHWKNAAKELSKLANHRLNAAYIAIDRHVDTYRKNKIALYYHGENGEKQQYTFSQLSESSNQFAHALLHLGVDRGNRVFIFLPRIPQLYIAFLGILKVGAIAGTLFSAFQEQALFDRLDNSQAKIIVTNEELYARIKKIQKKLPHLKKVIIVRTNTSKKITGNNIVYYDEIISKESNTFNVRYMHENDPAFMLYTSGTTGKPKGVVHRHLAIVQGHMTAHWALDLKDEDVYWCTADPGWVTGIVYGILGSWSNGVTAVVYDGRFDPDIWYSLIQEYKITVWYTAPTAIRMLMAQSDVVKKYTLSSLRHLASVGEPLNPEAIEWGLKAFGLPFHDTWWQTELGAISIANYASMDIRVGSMGKPIPGVIAEIIDDSGHILPALQEGNLALKPTFPSLMKEIWKRPKKYKSYFTNGYYISGDRAYKDKDGYFWFVGRADDVIKTSGERVGPFEVESALVEHPSVVEAGVIGKPDQLRGEIIKAFVVLKKGIKESETLKKTLQEFVKKHLAGHAYPREIEFIAKLPKTRSGKIMRRILKAKELRLPIGDTSTLEEY